MASPGHNELTHMQLEMPGYVLSTLAPDAFMLKHRAISIQSADKILIVSDQFHTKVLHL